MARGTGLDKLGAVITVREAAAAGLSWYELRKLRDSGELVQIAKGVYRRSDAPPSSFLDLVAVSRRYPAGTICLASALHFWDLTDELPDEVHLAVPRTRRPRISYPPTQIHVFAAETYGLGRESIELPTGEAINIYSAERSIVDALRLQHVVGSDLGHRSLRRYLRRRGAEPRRLVTYGRELRAERAVVSALEVLL